MSYFDEFLGNVPKTAPAPKAEAVKKVHTKANVVVEEKRRIDSLMEGLTEELDEHILSVLSYNYSTSSVNEDRPVPTREMKIRALWDYWAFIDIINFHGGSLAFSECHREMVSFKVNSKNFRQLVLEARGHLKSTLLCVGYVLWRIYQNPNIRIFVGTESLKLSKAFIREIEQYLVDDFNREHVWNSRPHIDGPLIPQMDSLGKSRRAIIRDISNEFGDEFSTASNASTSKKVWRAEAIQVVRSRTLKEPTVTAGSVGQTSTGFHFDEVLFDDVHTYDNCSSETKIAKVYSWIFDIESVLDPPYVDIDLVQCLHSVAPQQFALMRKWAISGGRMTVIGTRYDDADYYGHIIENNDKLNFSVHVRNVFVNGVDASDGFRWPEKWNEAVLEATKANFVVKHGSTGLQRFYSQYYNRIVNLEDAILNWDKINFINSQYVKLEEDGWVSIFNPDATLKAQFKPRLVIDPTSTASKKSDFCAMVVGGVYEGALYAVDFWMKKEKPEVWLKQMWSMIDKWNLHEVTVEMVGGFKVLEFTITQMWVTEPDKYRPISVKTYEGGTQGDAKTQRIETVLSPLVHNEMLYLPLGCSRMDDLRKQFLFFGKETAKDDGPDVLSILKEVAYSKFVRPPKNNQKGKLIAKVNARWGGVEYTVA